MAETWGNPEKKFVAASEPVMNGTEQAKDKYIHGALKFNVRFEGAQRATWVFCTTAPQAGEEIEVFQLTSGEFKSYWTSAAKELKTRPKGGGGFGGGAKSNLTAEQEIMDKALGHVINSINKGTVTGEGSPIDATFKNIDKAADYFYKKILDAGKKD